MISFLPCVLLVMGIWVEEVSIILELDSVYIIYAVFYNYGTDFVVLKNRKIHCSIVLKNNTVLL